MIISAPKPSAMSVPKLFIPTLYFFNWDNILDFVKSEIYVANLGLMLIWTVPNSGGLSSSPPTTDTDSVSGYILLIMNFRS